MKTWGGIASDWLMLLNVTAPPAATGFGDAVAVMVTGIRLACVGMRLFTQALSNVTAPAWLTGSRNAPGIASAMATKTRLRRRLTQRMDASSPHDPRSLNSSRSSPQSARFYAHRPE